MNAHDPHCDCPDLTAAVCEEARGRFEDAAIELYATR